MSAPSLNQLHLTLISGKEGAPINLLNQAYNHWKTTWRELLVLNGPLAADPFLRQDVIFLLRQDSALVGLICASFFDADFVGAFDLSYLQAFPKTVIEAELSPKTRHFMSIEFLSVDPHFRKHIVGLSLGSVLLGLSMKLFEESNASCVLGTARSKIPVDEMCFDFGFVAHGSINKFGHPCTLILNNHETLRQHPDSEVAGLVDRLWLQRLDLRPRNNDSVGQEFPNTKFPKAA